MAGRSGRPERVAPSGATGAASFRVVLAADFAVGRGLGSGAPNTEGVDVVAVAGAIAMVASPSLASPPLPSLTTSPSPLRSLATPLTRVAVASTGGRWECPRPRRRELRPALRSPGLPSPPLPAPAPPMARVDGPYVCRERIERIDATDLLEARPGGAVPGGGGSIGGGGIMEPALAARLAAAMGLSRTVTSAPAARSLPRAPLRPAPNGSAFNALSSTGWMSSWSLVASSSSATSEGSPARVAAALRDAAPPAAC